MSSVRAIEAGRSESRPAPAGDGRASDGARPAATVVVPTRARPGYLDVALGSIRPQLAAADAELLVISDGGGSDTRRVAERHGARVLELVGAPGLNAARNAGVAAARGALVVFADDDVEVAPGWLAALLAAAAGHPDADVFGGPIVPRLEAPPLRSCAADPSPITELDLGPEDREADCVWGANMAIRSSAFERVGAFADELAGCGDEEDWQRRHRALGGSVRYVAAASVTHRRAGADATLGPLARAAWARGGAARRYDEHRGAGPALVRELRTTAGCAWHLARNRCAFGAIMLAHAAGRLREALRRRPGDMPVR